MLTSRFRIAIIVSVSSLIIITIIASIIFLLARPPKQTQTGGSGNLQEGSLILYGYDSTANKQLDLSLGKYLTVDQQSDIRLQLEKILNQNNEVDKYIGNISPDSIRIDYKTNDISFTVKIDNPNETYKIVINTVSDKLTIYDTDENIMSIPPSNNKPE